MDKFQNKYRIPSARAAWWNYENNAAYFITICTAHREHFFGEIVGNKMNLSMVGVIADVLWHETKNHSDFMKSGAFVVMPNHIHAIVIIDKPDPPTNTLPPIVETLHATSLQQKNEFMSTISPKPHSLSTIIRSYKSAVTKHAHRMRIDFAWQTRFHDHIIRDREEYQRIENYITTNPERWEDDIFFKNE